MAVPLEIHRIGAHVIVPSGSSAMNFQTEKLGPHMAAAVRGIDKQVERMKIGTTDPELLKYNALSKVPTLVYRRWRLPLR